MARPERNNVDYFPFICKEGKSMYYIEHKYGNDGFATWIKILRMLAVTDYHFINLSNDVELMYLAAKCKISEEILKNIIKDLCSLGEIDSTLWNENKILFSQKFIDNIQDAYNKRNNKCITLEGLRVHLLSLGILNTVNNDLKEVNNTHSIVYNKKEDNKIENNILLKKETKFDFKKKLVEYGFKENLVEDWIKVRKTKKATNTETAFNLFIEEIEKRSCDINLILTKIIEKSWSGFKWIWIDNLLNENKNNNGTGKQTSSDRNKSDLIGLVEMARANLKNFEMPNGSGSD
jgi:hypothetical protein